MGSSAVTERVKMTDAQRAALMKRLVRVRTKVDGHLTAAETLKAQRFALAEQAKAAGVTNKDIADALGMTIPGVVKLIERGRANGE